MAKIKNHEDLVRDPETGIVKNKNRTAFMNARACKHEIIEKKKSDYEKDCKICDLEKQVDKLTKLVEQLVSSSESVAKKTSSRKKTSEGVENG